jgi:hypothetical protein
VVRALFVVLFLAACGGRGGSGPAWPKSAGTVEPDPNVPDGGESIAPRSSSLASIERSASPSAEPSKEIKPEIDTPAETKVETTPDKPDKPDPKPAEKPTTSVDEPTIEEIVIEIGGGD